MISKKINEIKVLMEYAVPVDNRQDAFSLLEEFSGDTIALNLLHAFYSYLPEGLDDTLTGLRLIAAKQGIFLLCATTEIGNYLYLVNQEQAEFLGNTTEGIWDSEVLEFFGYQNQEASVDELADLIRFPAYTPVPANANLCPVCAATQGECHILGCPVEVCPWCGGQLTYCTCRFTITGKNRLKDEGDLEAFYGQLNSKGRIPFAPGQRPSFSTHQRE